MRGTLTLSKANTAHTSIVTIIKYKVVCYNHFSMSRTFLLNILCLYRHNRAHLRRASSHSINWIPIPQLHHHAYTTVKTCGWPISDPVAMLGIRLSFVAVVACKFVQSRHAEWYVPLIKATNGFWLVDTDPAPSIRYTPRQHLHTTALCQHLNINALPLDGKSNLYNL